LRLSDPLARWVALSLIWPTFTRLIHGANEDQSKVKKVCDLANKYDKDEDFNKTQWEDGLEEIFDLKEENADPNGKQNTFDYPWLKDPNLHKFFIAESGGANLEKLFEYLY